MNQTNANTSVISSNQNHTTLKNKDQSNSGGNWHYKHGTCLVFTVRLHMRWFIVKNLLSEKDSKIPHNAGEVIGPLTWFWYVLYGVDFQRCTFTRRFFILPDMLWSSFTWIFQRSTFSLIRLETKLVWKRNGTLRIWIDVSISSVSSLSQKVIALHW